MPQGRGRVARTLVMVVTTMALCGGYRGTVSATRAPQAPSATRTIVAFGDSLTSGHGLPRDQAFPAVLERRLRAQGLPFRVVNHGVSGDTTSDGVRRLKGALAERPEILILALGANDAGWSSPVARWAHNPKVGGSNPPPATNFAGVGVPSNLSCAARVAPLRSSGWHPDTRWVCTYARSDRGRSPLSALTGRVGVGSRAGCVSVGS